MSEMATAKRRESGFAKHPGYRVLFEPCAKRVRVVFGGETIADSTRTRLLLETRHTPVYYFPREDVRMDLMTRSEHTTYCPFKGDAAYWTLAVGDKSAEDAVWSYEDPYPETAQIKDYVAFYWDRVDAWYEEDDEIFVHARDPHVRIDVVNSARPVRIRLGDVTLAETRRAKFLFETGLPTRYYIPPDDVRMDLLERSELRTACPYKGDAIYYSARVDDRLIEDVAWSYPDPLAECPGIKDYICFSPKRVDEIAIDGSPATQSAA